MALCRGLDVSELDASIDRLEKRIRQTEPTVRRIFIEVDSLKFIVLGEQG